MKGDIGGNVAVWILVACCLALTAVLVRRELRSSWTGMPSQIPRIQEQSDWQQYSQSRLVYGATDAQLTIVEFGDYECPSCRLLHQYMDSLLSLRTSVRVVYRHFPLKIHRFAIPAARASNCAADQGNFGQMHRVLYQYPDSFGLVSWWWFAHKAGVVDSMRFERCLQMREDPSLASDTLDGRRLGIVGTPTILIGPLRLNGVPPFDSLKTYINRAAVPKPPHKWGQKTQRSTGAKLGFSTGPIVNGYAGFVPFLQGGVACIRGLRSLDSVASCSSSVC